MYTYTHRAYHTQTHLWFPDGGSTAVDVAIGLVTFDEPQSSAVCRGLKTSAVTWPPAVSRKFACHPSAATVAVVSASAGAAECQHASRVSSRRCVYEISKQFQDSMLLRAAHRGF